MCQCSGSARAEPETRLAKAYKIVVTLITIAAIVEVFRDPRGR